MNNFTFHSPTEFVFGKDTQKQTGKLIKQYGGGKVLVVYGGGSAERSGLIKDVTDALEEENISYAILKGVRPNPTDDKVYEGIALAVREGVNFILAVGGGSVIDTAKAIAMGAVYPGDFWDFFKGSASPVAAIPVGVVLTIPAAGSEGSPNSVITRIDGLHKLSCRCKLTRPKFAI
ncbi:MAG: iron-containing alcohol dehydrogenase, partial [Muribaculaceae bacterium]|nr:iron-containing alcohol dehydrogenase [Muribaculaceae bacterium]